MNAPIATSKSVKRPLGLKITAALLAVGAVTTLATAYIANYYASEALRASARSQLTSVRSVLKDRIETYFEDSKNDLISQADSDTVRQALSDLSGARSTLMEELAVAGYKLDAGKQAAIQKEVEDYYNQVLRANLKKTATAEPPPASAYMHKDIEATILQYIYTVKNPAATGSKNDNTEGKEILAYPDVEKSLLEAFVKTTYSKRHDYFHRILNDHRVRFGYYDIFIIDESGFVVYSNFKELDFQGNLIYGPEKSTGLGQSFAAVKDKAGGEVFNTDLADYPKSYNAPAIFSSTPISDASGKSVGVFAYQLPLDRVDAIMTFKPDYKVGTKGEWEDVGLGKSGESFLVSLDAQRGFKAVTNSRMLDQVANEKKRFVLASDGTSQTQTIAGKLEVRTEATKNMAQGIRGEGEYADYRGVKVIGAYSPISAHGVKWGIVTKIDATEAFAPVTHLQYIILGVGGGLLLLTGLVGVVSGRSISAPVLKLTAAINKISEGDDEARAEVVSQDEIGKLAFAFNDMVDSRVKVQQKIQTENRQLQDGIQHLLMVMSDASDGDMVVRAKVTEGALGNVADAMNLMLENVGDLIKSAKKVSGKVATAAAEINQSATDLADGSVKQSDQLQGASLGAQELSTEAAAVTAACKLATKAAEQSEEAADRGAKIVREVIAGMEKIRESVQVNGKKIKRLGERSMEIGGILKTINEISAQTDMLALNASIEAGRAGEAGRGFSAVAEQVRALAERAKLATQQVEKLVGDIQQETAEAVAQTETQTAQVENGAQKVAQAGEALNDIVNVSSQSRDAVTKIANTAEQQAAKTGQMLTAVTGAATIAADSRKQVGGTRLSAEQLTQFAKDLDKQLAQFKVGAN
jgi:methyl-accepting chemotaxis protein